MYIPTAHSFHPKRAFEMTFTTDFAFKGAQGLQEEGSAEAPVLLYPFRISRK